MLFSHTNTIFEITMTTFAVNEQNGRRMERLNQALGPIESTRHLVSSQIPPSAPHNVSGKARSGLRRFYMRKIHLCTATIQQREFFLHIGC